jgi:hypothetical protein
MVKQWFYLKDGQQLGPFSWKQLYLQARAGAVDPEDLVWVEGMTDWMAASRVRGLLSVKPVFEVRTATPPPALPVAFSTSSAVSNALNNAQWYISWGEEQYGPYTDEDMISFAQQGNLHPEDLIWSEETGDWVRADSVGMFFTQ